MRVESTTDKSGMYSGSQATAATSSGYTSDDFMKMLLAQLSNQNPLEPMDDTEMMSQFTQLNSLQELQSIGSAITQVSADSRMSYAANLIGKQVTVQTANGVIDQGPVTAFMLSEDGLLIEINGNGYTLEDIVLVEEAETNG